MTLEYNILWVDDSSDWVAPVKSVIEDELNSRNLQHKITYKEDGADILNDIITHGPDLVILDYGLPDKKGDELIRDIRKHGEISDIIFYSQEVANTHPLNDWEGVFAIPRDDAEEKIIESVDNFIKCNNSIASMRGLIITEAIDVENQLTEIIKTIFADKAEILTQKILNKSWIDFGKKHLFLMSILNDKISENPANITDLKGYRDIFKNFDKEIIDQRNILAHSVKTISSCGKTITLKGINSRTAQIEFNNVWKNEIRANIRKHRSNLQNIAKAITE